MLSHTTDEVVFEQLPFDHPVYIMYTSGTTGNPKCIVHGAGGTLLQHLKELRLHTNLRNHNIFLYFTTCGWMMWNWYVSSLAIGTTLIQYDGGPFYPCDSQLIDVIEQENISVFGTSAKYLSTLEKKGIKPRLTHDLSALHTILSTGSPLIPQQFDFVYKSIKPSVC